VELLPAQLSCQLGMGLADDILAMAEER